MAKTGDEVQASRLIRTLAAHRAARADVAGRYQPHSREGDPGLGAHSFDNPVQDRGDRAILGKRKSDRLKRFRIHRNEI